MPLVEVIPLNPASKSSPRSTLRHSKARPLGALVPAITAKSFERFGFAVASLLIDWPSIVGAELAAYTEPERLRWPRAGHVTPADEPDAEHRRSATLVLKVDGARALDVQYRARQIIERINSHYGYRAVEALRIVQGPVRPTTRSATRPMPPVNTGASMARMVTAFPAPPAAMAMVATSPREVLRPSAVKPRTPTSPPDELKSALARLAASIAEPPNGH